MTVASIAAGTEVVPSVGSAEDIAALPFDQQAAYITSALVESKSWLAIATRGTDPSTIANFKAWAATVAEMTKQKGLAAEIQADALEMVRRAERGIGLAIRNGQQAGEIANRGDIGTVGSPGVVGSKPGSPRNGDLVRPSAFFPEGHQTMTDTYAMVDGVSDEQFEQALGGARDEGNLSRANVIRKVHGVKSDKLTPAERLNKIGDMADAGHTSDQIAKAVGNTEEYVRRLAKENGIDIRADKIMRGTRRIDHSRAVSVTVDNLAALASGLGQIDVSRVDVAQIEHWATSMKESIAALNRLRNDLLKELTQ